MHSQLKSWDTTRLWASIQKLPESDPSRQLLSRVMPDIERTLSKGGTAPVDFTLHDEEHAFRVAEGIVDLIPDNVLEKLTPFELALLLLSAYLHDIGMTPTRNVVKRHHQYILTKADGLLSEAEAKELRRWLDEAHGGMDLPVSSDAVTVAGLEKADELLAYYCRHRHNDWSEEWIRKKLTRAEPQLYPGWVDDLVTLCRSHHEGLEALQQPRFDARLRGPGQCVNLRYMAALLRVADVMEFDPERTPDVILAHREIAPNSRIYWHKDRFTFVIDRDRREFRLDATTPDAKTHKAVRETVEAVDRELVMCNALETSGDFHRGTFKDTRCQWPWPASVNAKVTEQGGRFVYIDGAFRPEPQHILKLLGGVELYKDPMVAVRELLQNALDAVKEQIARERLRRDNPGDPAWESKLGELHKVTLALLEDNDGVWLVCTDDGVGMTRAIIERQLLVSGARPSPDVHQLEREANQYGFSIDRSAQFGIGVLSYFMIADRMIITTRRSALAGGDPQGGAWRFETEGLGGFGELTPALRDHEGTEVRLRIRHDSVETLRAGLADYAKLILRYIPCYVEVRQFRSVSGFGPGWCWTFSDFIPQFLAGFKSERYSSHVTLLPSDEIQRRELEDQRWTELQETASRCIRCLGPIEGMLPRRLGRFRVHLPYFELNGGRSLAFLDMDENVSRVLPQGRLAIPLRFAQSQSWRGFAAPGPIRGRALGQRRQFVVEIDWHDGEISVDRQHLQIDERLLKAALNCIDPVSTELAHIFFDKDNSGPFSLLNSQLLKSERMSQKINNTHRWASKVRSMPHAYSWQAVRFPCVFFCDRPLGRSVPASVRWRGEIAPVLPRVWLHQEYMSLQPLADSNPDRIVFYDREPVLLWEQAPQLFKMHLDQPLPRAAFPPEWSAVVGFSRSGIRVLNANHPLVRSISRRVWADYLQKTKEGLALSDEFLMAHSSMLNAWVISNLWEEKLFWNGIRDNRPHLYADALKHVQAMGALPILVVAHDFDLHAIHADEMSVSKYALLGHSTTFLEGNCRVARPSASDWLIEEAEDVSREENDTMR